MSNNKMTRKQFVENDLNDLAVLAADLNTNNGSNLSHLEYDESWEVVTVFCKNGYKYHVNVAHDSYSAIVWEVMQLVSAKF